jgi:branched-chain amino acid transport system substrate-binding protein
LRKDSANAQRYGYDLVGVETFRTGDTDFSSQLTALKAAKPTWLMVVAQPPEMIKIINQASSMGLNAKLYGSFGSNDTTSVWQGTQGKVKGSYFYAPGVPAKGLMRDQTPYDLYVQKYRDVPIIFHIFGWDAVNIFVDAAKRAGTSTDREKIRAALGNTNGFPLATSGTVTWHNPPTGENLTPPVVLGVVTGPGTAKLIPG